MNKSLFFGAASFGLFAVSQSAYPQQSVGLVFSAYGGAPAAGDTAGYSGYIQTNWNSSGALNATGTNTVSGSGLLDSTGAATSIGYTLAKPFVDNSLNSFPYQASGSGHSDFWLDGGVAIAENNIPVTLTLSGLNIGGNYTLVAYLGTWASGSILAGQVSVGATTFYYSDAQFETVSGWVPITATNALDGYNDVANVAIFPNLTPTAGGNLTLTLTQGYLNSFYPYAGLAGVQIISNPVPEPATIWSFCVGILGLASFRIRRNRNIRAWRLPERHVL